MSREQDLADWLMPKRLKRSDAWERDLARAIARRMLAFADSYIPVAR